MVGKVIDIHPHCLKSRFPKTETTAGRDRSDYRAPPR
jgi:hypothetical protein